MNIDYREIIPEKLGVLPNSLPYRVVEKKAEFSEVPDELRHKIKFEVYQVSSSLLGSLPASSPDFSVTISIPELAGKRITLSYIPASEDSSVYPRFDEYRWGELLASLVHEHRRSGLLDTKVGA